MTLPSPGDVLGSKYRVGDVIAEGGMGIIHEGIHVQLEDAVAIKFLKPEVVKSAGNEVVKRFMREARTCIKIRSEHVVRVLDVDTLPSGVPYMVMERLIGRDLDAILTSSGPLRKTTAVDYVLQALEAIAEAHSLSIVHRDLKPANLFLAQRPDGSPCIKVLDFGISKIDTGIDGGMTHTQAVMGSPKYMSPEQLRASKNVDARTDIWAIGVVLYELLTGRAPFNGTSMTQIAASILEDVPASLGLADSSLEAVVMRCLAKRPDQRYVDVADLAFALVPFGSTTAGVSAGRITGVLERGTVPRLSPQAVEAVRRVQPSAPGAMTASAWGDSEPARPSSKRVGLFAAGALALAAVGLTLGALALRKDNTETVAHAAPPPSASSELPAPSVATPPTVVAVATRAESPDPPPPAAPLAPPPAAAPPAVAKAVVPSPVRAHVASPSTPAPPAPRPAATAPASMWSDRK